MACNCVDFRGATCPSKYLASTSRKRRSFQHIAYKNVDTVAKLFRKQMNKEQAVMFQTLHAYGNLSMHKSGQSYD